MSSNFYKPRPEGIPAGRSTTIDDAHEMKKALLDIQLRDITGNEALLRKFTSLLDIKEKERKQEHKWFYDLVSLLGHSRKHVAKSVRAEISEVSASGPEQIKEHIRDAVIFIDQGNLYMAAECIAEAAYEAYQYDAKASDVIRLYASAHRLFSAIGAEHEAMTMQDTASDIEESVRKGGE
ncbi:MAG: hypothetical protein KGH98_03790 [Candidatus Micrarchaeota archaeon]|nr:hypothetical protein [Candidatus Micrarchaeota archaeon]